MEQILYKGMRVYKSDYIKYKTKDLIEFGYTDLTEKTVSIQVDKILNGDKDLSVIGLFCKDEIKNI